MSIGQITTLLILALDQGQKTNAKNLNFVNKIYCKILRVVQSVEKNQPVYDSFDRSSSIKRRSTTLKSQASENNQLLFREDISEYVAQLQLHMALQARNLIPPLTEVCDSRQQLLQETQAQIEKLVSRQGI